MKKFNISAGIILIILSLISCNNSKAKGESNQKVSNLLIASHDNQYIEYFKSVEDEFKLKHKNKQINMEYIVNNSDLLGTLIRQYTAKEKLPDIVGLEVNGIYTGLLVDNLIENMFVPLEDKIPQERLDNVDQTRLALYTNKSHLYGLEITLAAMAYYYQPELLKAANIPVPKTYEEMVELGPTAQKNGFALSIIQDDSAQILSLIRQRGGNLFDQNGDFILPENKKTQDTFVYVMNLIKKGLDNGAFKLVLSNDFWNGALTNLFGSHQVVGAIMPDWFSGCCLKPQAKSQAGEWSIAPSPYFENSGYTSTTWGGTGFGVTQSSESKELAYDLLSNFWIDEEHAENRFMQTHMFPIVQNAFELPEIKSFQDSFYTGLDNYSEIFEKSSQNLPTYYMSPWNQYFIDAFNNHIIDFYHGEINGKELLNFIIDEVNDQIEFDS